MTSAVEKLIEQAKQLTTAERLQLARELLEGLEIEDQETLRAWEEEIARRMQALTTEK